MNRKQGLSSSTVLYVGQLPFDWNEDVVKSVVCGSGSIVDVRLGYDYAGKNKGFCFVEYITPQDAQNAMRLLDQIKIVNPTSPGQFKKLRIELSKEGLRSNSQSESRKVLNLNRNFIPSYVQLPQEMMFHGPPIPQNVYQQPINPSHFQAPEQSQFGFDQSSSSHLPPHLTAASKYLPQVASLPFSKSDKINDTLSLIPPAQLIELIANLKSMLADSNSSRASELLQLSPNIAATTAQALLLMGFIDSDVIGESMSSAAAQPQPMPNQQLPPSLPQSLPHSLPPSIPPNPFAQQMAFNDRLQTPPQHQSKWPHLPPMTQAKLAAMDTAQADLIAQVLALPADQISSLPPDKQSMVMNLRAQYL